MTRVRVIPVMHIKGPNLVKGIHLEGLRVIGKPAYYAKRYYTEGADELILIDTVASLYGRSNLYDIIKEIVSEVFIPVTVGGGVRSVDDAKRILDVGAEKVAINTAAIENPRLITQIAHDLGNQACCVYIEARRKGEESWEALTDNGRVRHNIDALDWAEEVCRMGAGELIVTSMDRDGTGRGFDSRLCARLVNRTVPVIMHGGYRTEAHIRAICKEYPPDGLGISSAFHYYYFTPPEGDFTEGVLDFARGRLGTNVPKGMSIKQVKQAIAKEGHHVRNIWGKDFRQAVG